MSFEEDCVARLTVATANAILRVGLRLGSLRCPPASSLGDPAGEASLFFPMPRCLFGATHDQSRVCP